MLPEVKVCIIGDTAVGKTSLSTLYSRSESPAKFITTMGASCFQRKAIVDGHEIHLELWDTPGHEGFRSLAPTYYREAQVVICVFDVTNEESFKQTTLWLSELRTYTAYSDPNVVVGIAGNKCDNTSRVAWERCAEAAATHGIKLFRTSAITGNGVLEMLDILLRDALCLSHNNVSKAVASASSTFRKRKLPGQDIYTAKCGSSNGPSRIATQSDSENADSFEAEFARIDELCVPGGKLDLTDIGGAKVPVTVVSVDRARGKHGKVSFCNNCCTVVLDFMCRCLACTFLQMRLLRDGRGDGDEPKFYDIEMSDRFIVLELRGTRDGPGPGSEAESAAQVGLSVPTAASYAGASSTPFTAAQLAPTRLPEFDLVDAQLLEGGQLLLLDNSGIPAPATVVSVDLTQGKVSCCDCLCSLFVVALSPCRAIFTHLSP
jgi:small GTP-binding protein